VDSFRTEWRRARTLFLYAIFTIRDSQRLLGDVFDAAQATPLI